MNKARKPGTQFLFTPNFLTPVSQLGNTGELSKLNKYDKWNARIE